MPARSIPDIFAVYAFDPGTTTGVARGIFLPRDTLASTLATGVQAGWETWETKGPIGSQAMEIALEFTDWEFECHVERGIALQDIHLVSEDFQLRPSKARGAGSDPRMLDPVRVIAGVETLMWSRTLGSDKPVREIERQMPGLAKGRFNSDRLRRVGGWVVGSEHRRDANKHLCYRVNQVLEGK